MSDKNLGLILVVEDDDALRTAIRLNLVKRGRLVREATTLQDARRVFDEIQPNVLLLDLNLPDGSGQDLMVELRARGIVLPTVVMSAAGISSLRLAETQPLWYLAKPFRIEALLDVLTLAESVGPALRRGAALSDRTALDLPTWARELRSACIAFSRSSSRAIRTMSLSLRVASGPSELPPQSFATRLAGEYGLAARSELVGGILRVWLRREEGGAAAATRDTEPSAAIELPTDESRAEPMGAAQADDSRIDGYSEVSST